MAAVQNSRRSGSTKGFVPPQFAKVISRFQSRVGDFTVNSSNQVTGWKDSGGNGYNLGGSGNLTLQLVNGVPYVAFGAASTGVLSNSNALLTNSYSLVMRVRNDVRHDNMALLSTSGGRTALIYKSGGAVLWHYQTNYFASTTAPAAGTGFTLIVNYNATTKVSTIYIDGVQVGTASGGDANAGSQLSLLIGNYPGGNFQLKDTLLGEIVTYSAELTATSIAAWTTYLAPR